MIKLIIKSEYKNLVILIWIHRLHISVKLKISMRKRRPTFNFYRNFRLIKNHKLYIIMIIAYLII